MVGILFQKVWKIFSRERKVYDWERRLNRLNDKLKWIESHQRFMEECHKRNRRR